VSIEEKTLNGGRIVAAVGLSAKLDRSPHKKPITLVKDGGQIDL
jgi:hypothetical protein